MKLTALRNTENWVRRISILQKRLTQPFRRTCNSVPVFVLGKQRSGTSMLMHVFHRHRDSLVFDEHRSNEAFDNFRIRNNDRVRGLVDEARFPVVCFKPISDSHRIGDLYSAFPGGHFIWIYRNYEDVANSALRKFASATRAIRLVCTDQPGGGWFQEGVSPSATEVLQDVYRPTMSEFDLACLAWWARNQIILESGLIGKQNVTVLKYEALVSSPQPMLTWLFDRIGIENSDRVGRKITARSVRRHSAPPLDASVEDLCTTTLAALNAAFNAESPPVELASGS